MQIGNIKLKEKSILVDGVIERALTKIEHRILSMLAEVPDTDVAKVTILTALYGTPTRCTSRSLDVHICHIRTKIAGSNLTILTTGRFGFRLIVNTPEYANS